MLWYGRLAGLGSALGGKRPVDRCTILVEGDWAGAPLVTAAGSRGRVNGRPRAGEPHCVDGARCLDAEDHRRIHAERSIGNRTDGEPPNLGIFSTLPLSRTQQRDLPERELHVERRYRQDRIAWHANGAGAA